MTALTGAPAASSSGRTSSASSSIGPRYCPRENTLIASRGPPAPMGTACAEATAFRAAGAVCCIRSNAPRSAVAASAPRQSKR